MTLRHFRLHTKHQLFSRLQMPFGRGMHMITRIELTNFMSHANTVIEPAPGLTVLVGPNNVGKSAVVAALQILCHNENSTYVLRHGERECSVRVQTDDGHVIEWRRKTASSYVIDNQTFDRLGRSGLPDELHRALRLPKVDADSDADFDVHFGTQKSPIFLLGNSAAVAARFFASSSDAIRLVTMQKRHKEKLSDALREKNRLDSESRQVNAELELLEPIVGVNHRLETTEDDFDQLVRMGTWLEEARRHDSALFSQAALVAERAAYASALSSLSPPPQLVSTEPLEKLITELQVEERKRAEAASRVCVVSELPAPPELTQTEPLENLIVAAEVAEAKQEAAIARADALVSLLSPPLMHEVGLLAELTERISTHAEHVEFGEDERRSLLRLSVPPQISDSDALQGLIERLEWSGHELAAARGRNTSLLPVGPPPELGNESDFLELLSALVRATAQSVRWENELASLSTATSPPVPTETNVLNAFVAQLEQAVEDVSTCQAELQNAGTQFTTAMAELREQAAGSNCPTCGSALDPDRVIARATTGLGVHDHD